MKCWPDKIWDAKRIEYIHNRYGKVSHVNSHQSAGYDLQLLRLQSRECSNAILYTHPALEARHQKSGRHYSWKGIEIQRRTM